MPRGPAGRAIFDRPGPQHPDVVRFHDRREERGQSPLAAALAYVK